MKTAKRIGIVAGAASMALAVSAARAQSLEGDYYSSGSYAFSHCLPPCACPPVTHSGWLMGQFSLAYVSSDPKFDYYEVKNVQWQVVNTVTGEATLAKGDGTYAIDNVWNRFHQMTLNLTEDSNGLTFHFDSGLTPTQYGSGSYQFEMVSDIVSCEQREVSLWFNSMASCYMDCDHNGLANIDDFICFNTAFAVGDPYADCDGSGTFTIDDYICYQVFFCCGC